MDREYYIWSFEHKGWWKPAWRGYTESLEEAGRYSFEEALKICDQGNYGLERGIAPNEAMIPVK